MRKEENIKCKSFKSNLCCISLSILRTNQNWPSYNQTFIKVSRPVH